LYEQNMCFTKILYTDTEVDYKTGMWIIKQLISNYQDIGVFNVDICYPITKAISDMLCVVSSILGAQSPVNLDESSKLRCW
jgi:hypothetical protein